MLERRRTIAGAVASLCLAGASPAGAALDVTVAELNNDELRVEGEGAAPGSTIELDGVAQGTADDEGRFDVQVDAFEVPDSCAINVSDGQDSVIADLEGCLTPCQRADFDANGVVSTTDLLQILAAYGDCPGCPEELTGDGFVGVPDVLELLANWGPCP